MEWKKDTEIFVLSTAPDWVHFGVIVKPGIEPILTPLLICTKKYWPWCNKDSASEVF